MAGSSGKTRWERRHKELDEWLDEVEEMEGEDGLEGIVGNIFGKRQELMGEIAEYIIRNRFSEELERETAATSVELNSDVRASERGLSMIGEIKLDLLV